MAGVSLVGLSGSMIKDSVKEPNVSALEELPQSEPVEDPELTKVLVGAFRSFCAAGTRASPDRDVQACSS